MSDHHDKRRHSCQQRVASSPQNDLEETGNRTWNIRVEQGTEHVIRVEQGTEHETFV